MKMKESMIDKIRNAKSEEEVKRICKAQGMSRDHVHVGDIRVEQDAKLLFQVITGNVSVYGTAKLETMRENSR